VETSDTLRTTDSLGVRFMTWIALPIVLTWMTLRALAHALAALVRRAGTALRITLSTMADGLRHILARTLVLARAVADLLLRPLRLAWAATRRLAARVAVVLRALAHALAVRVAVVLRAVAVVVGVVVLATSRAASIAQDLIASISTLVATTARRAVARMRLVVAPLRTAIRRATSRAASTIRRAAAVLQSSIGTSLRRAAALVRRSSDSVHLALRRARASIIAAVRGARSLLPGLSDLGQRVRAGLFDIDQPVLRSVPHRGKRRDGTLMIVPRRGHGTQRAAGARRIRRDAGPRGGSTS